MKAVVDDKIPFMRGQIERLADEVVYRSGSDISSTDVKDADILIVRTRTKCDGRLLEGSKVRLIVTATIGYDHIDTSYCSRHNIEWTNCPGCNARSVCCYVINALSALNKLKAGLTIGIVGVGNVGSLVAQEVKRLGMRLLLCDPPRRDADNMFEDNPFVDLDRIVAEADIITFHTPLTRDGLYPTWHLSDTAFFNSLKKQPVLINASRGAVVDNNALLEALRSGQVSEAVIDTWEGEPDEINIELLQRCAIATPHIAGYSADGKANATRMTLRAVARFLNVSFRPSIALPDAEPMSAETLMSDSMLLKGQPQLFESMREHYPTRREKMKQ